MPTNPASDIFRVLYSLIICTVSSELIAFKRTSTVYVALHVVFSLYYYWFDRLEHDIIEAFPHVLSDLHILRKCNQSISVWPHEFPVQTGIHRVHLLL